MQSLGGQRDNLGCYWGCMGARHGFRLGSGRTRQSEVVSMWKAWRLFSVSWQGLAPGCWRFRQRMGGFLTHFGASVSETW